MPAGLAAAGAACWVTAGSRNVRWPNFLAVWLVAQAGVYVHTTVRVKLRVWKRELDRLGLHGDEQLLDLGCGRGAVLIAAAQRLPRGKAVGIDLVP